jgi:hypothetical protein
MKKTVLIGFCILTLCSSFLLVNIETALASEPGYTLMEAYGGGAVTVDGKWTSTTEWSDAFILPMTGTTLGPNGIWAYKMDASSGTYLMSFLIESPDNTNDAGDRWIICIDGSADGGTAPKTDDVKIEVDGHSTLLMYAGTGTGWSLMANKAVTWKDSLTTSASNTASHYVLEVQADKAALGAWGANPPPSGVYVSMYDASNASKGTVAWPPTASDNPSRWGVIATYDTAVPEGLSIAFFAVLSTIAVAGAFVIKKRAIIPKLR